MQELIDQIATLGRRVEALEGNAAIAAPFRVTDEEGRSILEVEETDGETRLMLFSPGRDSFPALVLVADRHGGGMIAFDSTGCILRAVLADPQTLNRIGEELTIRESIIRTVRRRSHAPRRVA